MANDSRVSSHGVGTIHLLPSLSIDNVLYVPRSLMVKNGEDDHTTWRVGNSKISEGRAAT